MGTALADAGDFDAAVKVLRQGSGAYPGDSRVHLQLARSLSRVRPPQAGEVLRAYSVARALQPELGHDLAHELDDQGRTEEADAVWRDLVRRRPLTATHLVCYGNNLRERGRLAEANPILERAVAAIREAIRLRPDDTWAHNNLGRALRALGRMDEAVVAHREAIRLEPDESLLHFNLGVALAEMEIHDEAIAAFREAVRLDPDNAASHYNLGILLAEEGKPREAIAAYREAIRIEPESFEAQIRLGAILCDVMHDYRGAEAASRAAVQLRPDSFIAHGNLGAALDGQGRMNEAMAEYREAVRIKPESANAHAILGATLVAQGKRDDAVKELRTAARLNPTDAVTHNNIAWGLALAADSLPARCRNRARTRPQGGPVAAKGRKQLQHSRPGRVSLGALGPIDHRE